MARIRHKNHGPPLRLPLIERRYIAEARRRPYRELSARVEAHGAHWHLPLGTMDKEKAVVRAAKLASDVEKNGWISFCAREPREITLGILWSRVPYVCTYTTLFTRPGGLPKINARIGLRVALVEPEACVRAALLECLSRCSGIACVGVFENLSAILKSSVAVDLLLYNHDVRDTSIDSVVGNLRRRNPDASGFPYMIYPDSDTLFSLGALGVSRGYFLRRRPPALMLEPIDGDWADPVRLHRRICVYVQDLYSVGTRDDIRDHRDELTTREHEIMHRLREGGTDKEIAAAIGISIWTIRTHLKRIYRKLHATTRTEAVLRYMQK